MVSDESKIVVEGNEDFSCFSRRGFGTMVFSIGDVCAEVMLEITRDETLSCGPDEVAVEATKVGLCKDFATANGHWGGRGEGTSVEKRHGGHDRGGRERQDRRY